MTESIIRPAKAFEAEVISTIINDAAQAYKGVIPEDRWKDPYMPLPELTQEMKRGVRFWVYEENGKMEGVMGIQPLGEVALIRHAYVFTQKRKQGIGTQLLHRLLQETQTPILVGTWQTATWAISLYEKNWIRIVTEKTKDELLRKYWSIPDRQVETSVVLADSKWFSAHPSLAHCG